MAEAAFASNEPVRLLKAGTVVNWMAGADTGTFVIVVARKENFIEIIYLVNSERINTKSNLLTFTNTILIPCV